MKRLLVLMCALGLSACATRTPMPVWDQPADAGRQAAAAPRAPVAVDANGVEVERIPFRAGVSSTTVEKLAHEQGCTGNNSQGAGLMTPQGPVEIYRMVCDSNKVFMARCEFRQCRPLSAPPPGGYAAAAPMTAGQAGSGMAATAGRLAPRQVPRLNISWNCGACTPDPAVATMISSSYYKLASTGGYAVSDAETATMSIIDFAQRAPMMRMVFGVFAGKDMVSAQTVFRGETIAAEDTARTAVNGINAVSEAIGTQTFKRISAKVN